MIVFWAFLISTNLSSPQDPAEKNSEEYSLSQVHQTFIADNQQYSLLPYIIRDSEKISVRRGEVTSSLQRGKDYSINYTNGVLYLNTPISPLRGEGRGEPQDTITCVYERLPFNLPREYYHRKLPLRGEGRGEPQNTEDRKQPTHDSRLTTHDSQLTTHDSRFSLRGTKTFGISVGSRHSPSFDQSMQIQLDGKLSPEMQIEGTLRDDGVPLDPEGTTQELKEMDEIYLNVRTPNKELRLGDFDLSLPHSKFGELRRKQEGVLGKIGDHTLLSGALSKGKWTHKEFEGTIGKQGPYELSSQSTVGGIIVAGSERVWINGKLTTRGEDYTIDYSQGTLTFTPKLPVEDGDRIITEFQQKDESYRRTLFMGNHTTQYFRILLFKEDDINNSPLSFTLTPERIKSLSNTDSTEVWVSGATPSDKGSYIKVDSIYEYVGYPNGNYEISFTRVSVADSSEGDYDFDPMIVCPDGRIGSGYRYVGKGNGSYITKIRVPLPQNNSLVSIGYGKNIPLNSEASLSQLSFDIEGGATKFNPNTFAQHSSNTRDNQIGKAFIGEIGIGNNRTTNHEPRNGKWEMSTKVRNLDENFHFPGTSDTLPLKSLQLSGTLSPLPSLSTSAQIIKTPYDLTQGAGIELTLSNFPTLSYQYLGGKTHRTDELITSYNVGSVAPFIRLQECKGTPTTHNSRFTIHDSRTTTREIGMKSEYLNLGILEKNIYNPEPRTPNPDSRTKYRTSSLSISKAPLNLYYAYKQKFEGNRTSVMDLGTLKFSSHGLDLAYDLTSLERKSFEEEYYRVQKGQGSFSFDSLTSRYYPDSHGDYEKRLIPSGELSIYKNFSFSHSLALTPNPDFSVRFATNKRGEGTGISFWRKVQDAFDDRNRINIATRLFELYANYVKEDWRENKNVGAGFKSASITGNQEILEINFRHTPIDLSYTTSHSNRWQQSFLTREERSNTIGAGFTSHFSLLASHFLLQGEERKITEPPYSDAHLYGYSGEPTLTYELDNKRFETRIKLTNWLSDTQAPPSV